MEHGIVNALDQACSFASNIPCTHAELEKVVVDIETMSSFRVNKVGLGQNKKMDAHECEGQAIARFGGSGSRPTQEDYGSESEEGIGSDGNGGSQGGQKVNTLQDEQNATMETRNNGNIRLENGMEKKEMAQVEL